MKLFLTARKLAGLLKIHRATLSRRIKRGQIKAERDPVSGYWRIPFSSYEEMIKKK
jgi:hypothetical protein